ncbi:hypothetical protein M3Y98_00179900 [Aphelenchoides besseyi]|nr:hypothetical protein M3Y98_00179900 [Aphelenchoides besseyi]KAI6200096.1 hypothetical protein M3Y96_00696900 [Aphelenchoides besseyi]
MPSDKDLVAVKIAPKNAVKELLENAQDLSAAIDDFQKHNSLILTPLHSVLKIFDLHDQRRFDFHQTVIAALAEKLSEKIRELGSRKQSTETKKLEFLLGVLFKLHDIVEVRPIVLETLRHLPKVSSKILKKIAEDKSLYDEANVTVKQQIWLMKEASLFVEAVEPLLDSYIEEKDKILTSIHSPTHFFNCDSTKTRRQCKQVKGKHPSVIIVNLVVELISMIGLHEKLYRRLADLIRERFVNTGNVHYCSLRLEIIMTIHDVNVDYVVELDPCHDLVWLLQAIVRDRHLDNQQTTKLKGLLDKKKIMEANLGDMSMVAADPHVVYFLGCSAIRVLNENAKQCCGLPRESNLLQVVLRILYLSTSTMRIINEGIRDQKVVVNSQCMTRFVPLLLREIAVDRFRAELQRAPEEVANEFINGYAVEPLNRTLIEFVQSDVVPAFLLFFYVLDLLSSKRRLHSASFITEYVRVLCEAKDKILMQDPWAHVFAAQLAQSPSSDVLLADSEFVNCVVQFFITGIEHNAHNRFHIIRVCYAFHSQLPEELMEKLMSTIDPASFAVSLRTASNLDQNAFQRFEKEFRRFVASRAREPSPQAAVELPTAIEPLVSHSIADPLSSMLFDE